MKANIKNLPGSAPLQTPPLPSAQPSSQRHENLLPVIYLTQDQLPSKGLAYPKYFELSYRPYTFGEIQKINQSKINTKQKLAFVMEGINTSFDKELLTLSDLSYIALLRKISTIGGHKVNVSARCTQCRHEVTEVLDFGTSKSIIEFQDLLAPELPIRITFSNYQEYAFKPITFKSFCKIIEQGLEGDTIALITHQCIDPSQYDELYKVIENSTYEDQVLLEELDKYLEHNIKPVPIACKNKVSDKICGHINLVELSGGEALLLPFREPKKSHSSRIRFGS